MGTALVDATDLDPRLRGDDGPLSVTCVKVGRPPGLLGMHAGRLHYLAPFRDLITDTRSEGATFP